MNKVITKMITKDEMYYSIEESDQDGMASMDDEEGYKKLYKNNKNIISQTTVHQAVTKDEISDTIDRETDI